MDDLIAIPLEAILFGTLFGMMLCVACGPHKRPSFWLSPLPALATGIAMFLMAFGGPSMFTLDFWEGFDEESLIYWLSFCGLSGLIGFCPSLVVMAIYRFIRKRRPSERAPQLP